MSSFGGHMREYIEISLDRFDGDNLDSTVYFLSHKHEDHMVGLSSNNLLYRLQSNSHIKLYCSEVTRDLLLADQRFVGLAKSLVVNENEVPFSLPVPDPTTGKVKYNVTVTMIPASHCPGSVMFLFEGPEGTALYTGDFRLARGDIARVDSLRSGNSAKPIDSLYIDTTFCVPEAFYIPSREECVAAVVDVAREWTSISREHMVLIYHRAALGYEYLFNQLAEKFKTKVHLGESKYAQCQKVQQLSNFGTRDGSSTQIHACKWSEVKVRHKSALPCGYTPKTGAKLQVKVITVSTMWFTQHVGMEEIIVPSKRNRPRHLRACYSFHSSYSEVRDVVMYLNPRRVFPNVIPMGHTEKQIQDRLNYFLKLASTGKPPSTPSKPTLLGKQRPTLKRPHKVSNSQSTDSDLFFDDSPIKTKKQKMSKDESITKGVEEDKLDLKWDASQSTEDPNSQPHPDGPADSEVDSSYHGSQRSNASCMDLVATDLDLTPKKPPPNKDVQSTPESIECVGEVVKGGGESESVKPTTNGVIGDGSHGHSDELFSEEEKEVDQEVLSAREVFKPFKDGSYGSHVTYASDVELSELSDADGERAEVTGEDEGEGGTSKNSKEHQTNCQNVESCVDAKLEECQKLNGDQSQKHSSNGSGCLEADPQKGTVSATALSSGNPETHTKPDGESVAKEDEQGKNEPSKSDKNKEVVDDDDDDDDVIMLDSDVVEEGEVTGVLESPSEKEEAVTPEPQPSTSTEQEVIDLTADDDDHGGDNDDDDIVSMGVRRFYREDGDGYHGDSESEENDTDGIMTDSDGSFAKASYEKTKTRMKNGKSRRASAINGFSSSDSDSDTDVTIDEAFTSPARFPIAGSCHFSRTRLNGFHSTLVDNEVIVLDDQDDDPPPNVTVVDIAGKEQEAAKKSKASLVSAEDLVSGAMEMASAATAANSRLVSTIQRLRTSVSKPVLSGQTTTGDVVKHVARKSAPRVVSSTTSKTSPKKNKVVLVHGILEEGDGGAANCTKTDNRDIAPSETAVVSKDEVETGQTVKNDCILKNDDSGNIDEIQSKQGTPLKDSPPEVLTR